RDTVQLETAVTTISQEYLLEFTSEYGISEALHPELPCPEDRIVDFPKGKIHLSQLSVIGAAKGGCLSARGREKNPSMHYQAIRFPKKQNNRFFWVDEGVFLTIVDWRTSAPKDGMPAENTYSPKAVMILNTHRTSIQKQPEALLCLVGLSYRYYLGDEVYLTFLHDDDRDSLIRAPNLTKVKTGSRPRATHEVPPLTVTANRMTKKQRHVDPRPTKSTCGGKSIAAIELGMGSTRPVSTSQGVPVDVSDPDPLSFADPQSRPPADVTQSAELSKELESMRALSSDLQVSNDPLSQQVSNLQAQVMGEEKLKAAFEYDHRPQVVIEHGLRLAMMKCDESTELRQAFTDVVSAGIAKGISEGLKHGVKHEKADLNLEAIKAYDPKAEAKYITSLHAVKDLKYPIVDQLENLKDAPMDVIMNSLHLESDTEDDAP
nr:hypothetical protein [Tanacetum cinerariifolium]